MYSVRLIYTLGAFHTTRTIGKNPETFVTTTSRELAEQIRRLGIQTTPQSSLITGFNGLMLGFAKINNIQGIGLYGELNRPKNPAISYRQECSADYWNDLHIKDLGLLKN